ncbi:MAG: HDOD domain-containing protein [Deltaproteobacteria bacterium]|nr:HDOD domain-containing protein [Deltaproteobacteria bacterium]
MRLAKTSICDDSLHDNLGEELFVVKILLVDDDPDIVSIATLMLQSARPEWKFTSLCDPAGVEQLLRAENFDAIVSDLEMPGMTGIELLTQVAVADPLMVRVMVSSKAEAAREVEALGIAHRFFAKPCDYRQLAVMLDRSLELRKRLRGSRLRALIHSMPALPSPPRTYFALQKLLGGKGFHASTLVDLLKKEMSLTAFMLKAANSSYYGARQPIESIERAVSLLGVTTIQSLVLGAELFSQLDARKSKEFGVDRLFDHSARVAGIAASLAERRPETRPLKDLAYTAGLLHDVGRLVCIHSLSDTYKKIMDKAGADFHALYLEEIAVLGVSHQEIGAYLLSLWGLPEPIVEAVAYHHQPLLSPSKEISVLTFVAAGDMIDHGLPDAVAADEPNEVGEYLEQFGMGAKDLII